MTVDVSYMSFCYLVSDAHLTFSQYLCLSSPPPCILLVDRYVASSLSVSQSTTQSGIGATSQAGVGVVTKYCIRLRATCCTTRGGMGEEETRHDERRGEERTREERRGQERRGDMQRERREQQGRHIRQERARGEDSESEERSGTHTSIHSHHQLLYVITSHPSHSSLHSSCLSLICHPRHTHPLSPLTPTPPRLTFSFFPPTSPGCTSRWCCFFCCLIFLTCFLDFVLSRVVGFSFPIRFSSHARWFC